MTPAPHYRPAARLNLLIAGMIAVLSTAASADNGWQTPRIQGYGKVKPVAGAQLQPAADRQHRIVKDVVRAAPEAGQVNEGLDRVARLVNLYALAGVPADNLDLVAVIHGKATTGVLDDAAYEAEFGITNPSTPLIQALVDAGVRLYVCSQALAHHGIDPEAVNDQVTIVAGALPALAIFQQRGYAFLP